MEITMNKKREFGDSTIYTVSYYIWWFLLGNFYFWLMNIPFIFITLPMELNGYYHVNLLLILSLLPMGPALTALLSVMGKLTREKDINITREFFKAYKVNFFDSLLFWSIGIIILIIAWIDIIMFNNNSNLYFLKIIPTIILVICFALGIYIFPIISRFYLKKKDMLKLSFMYLIKKINICIIAFIGIAISWIILTKINGAILVLFSVSIMCYIIMFLEQGMLQDIEKKLKNTDSSTQ